MATMHPTLVILVATLVGWVYAQQIFEGGTVTYNLPPGVGACGRPCDGVFNCTGFSFEETCKNGSAGIPAAVFDANYPTICTQFVVNIDMNDEISAQVCDRCATCGPNDLQLSDPAAGLGSTELWLLLPPAASSSASVSASATGATPV